MKMLVKSLSAFVLTMSLFSAAHAVGKEEAPRPPEVKAFEDALKDLGLSAGKSEGVAKLADARPELRSSLKAITKKLMDNREFFKDPKNKEKASELVKNVDIAASEAADLSKAKDLAPSSGKVLQAMEALPGILAEIAAGGVNADIQKAIDISAILTHVSKANLKKEGKTSDGDLALGLLEGTEGKPATVADIIILLNKRLGTTKDGKKITIDDLIKKCLEMMRKGSL